MKKKEKCDYLDKVVSFVGAEFGDREPKIMEDAWRRYRELLSENSNESKAVKMHTVDRIYPGIAMFDALTANGVSRDDAARFLNDYYKWRSVKMAKLVKRMAAFPGIYKVFPSIFTSMTRKMFGEAAGFKAKFYDVPKGEMRFDMLVCPYYEICKKYGCPEIVPGYCESDDICYSDMHPKLEWGRTRTIGKGGDCCDFKLRVVK